MSVPIFCGLCSYFFFNDTATTEIYTLSLHDALPISWALPRPARRSTGRPSWWTFRRDRKSTRLNSSHLGISYAVFCLKKKKNTKQNVEKRTRHSTTKTRAPVPALRQSCE